LAEVPLIDAEKLFRQPEPPLYNNWQFNPAESRPDYYYHPFENFQAGRVNPSPRYYGPMEHLISASQNDATNYWWHRAQAGRAQPFAYEIGIQPYLCDAFRAPKTAGMPCYLAAHESPHFQMIP
jgi:hypothetical protein